MFFFFDNENDNSFEEIKHIDENSQESYKKFLDIQNGETFPR